MAAALQRRADRAALGMPEDEDQPAPQMTRRVLNAAELRIGDDYSENVKVIVKKNMPAAIMVGDQYIKEEWGDFTVDKSRNVILYR